MSKEWHFLALGFIFGFAVSHICNMTFFGNTIALVLYVKNTGESVRANLFCGQSGEGGKTIYSFRFTLLTLMAFRNSMQFVKFYQRSNRFSVRRPFRWNVGTGEWCDWLCHLPYAFVDFVTDRKLICFELSNCLLCAAWCLVFAAVCCGIIYLFILPNKQEYAQKNTQRYVYQSVLGFAILELHSEELWQIPKTQFQELVSERINYVLLNWIPMKQKLLHTVCEHGK